MLINFGIYRIAGLMHYATFALTTSVAVVRLHSLRFGSNTRTVVVVLVLELSHLPQLGSGSRTVLRGSNRFLLPNLVINSVWVNGFIGLQFYEELEVCCLIILGMSSFF